MKAEWDKELPSVRYKSLPFLPHKLVSSVIFHVSLICESDILLVLLFFLVCIGW